MGNPTTWLKRWRKRLRALLRKDAVERELDEELAYHVELETEKNIRAGMSPEEARRHAAIAFGAMEKYKEEVRDSRALGWASSLSLDFKLGYRMLIKHPGLTLIGGLGIAVGVAVSAGFFGFQSMFVNVNLPLDEGDRIIAIENWSGNGWRRPSLYDFVSWGEELTSVQELGAFRTISSNLIVPGGAVEAVSIAEMTASGFGAARVPPLLGRPLVEEDQREGAPPVVVISHTQWQTRFASDPEAVGREVRLGAVMHTVVGVMPEGFAFPLNHHFWIPLRTNPASIEPGQGPAVFVFGRLGPETTMDQAQAELTTVGRRMAAANPDTHEQLRPAVMPYTHPLLDVQGASSTAQALLLFLFSILLVGICVNVAVLVYARTATRVGEITVRAALGASRRRIVGQLFVEALVLSTMAAMAGLLIDVTALKLVTGVVGRGNLPFWITGGLTPETIVFSLGLAVAAAAIVGVVPGIQATGRQLESRLRHLGGGTGMQMGRTWTLLIVAQVAVAVCALSAAAGLSWGDIADAANRPTFPEEQFLVLRLSREEEVTTNQQSTEAQLDADARFANLQGEIARRLAGVSGITDVTFSRDLPGRGPARTIELEDPTGTPGSGSHSVGFREVDLRYFDVVGIPLLVGRPFGPADTAAVATAVLVNRSFVDEVLGGGNALGLRFRYRSTRIADSGVPDPWFEIVGVVRNLYENPIDPMVVEPAFYRAVSLGGEPMSFVVRAEAVAPAALISSVRRLVAGLDLSLVADIEPLDTIFRDVNRGLALMALALTLVFLSVLLLSGCGIYALMSFAVTRRQREIGIRTAIGASRRAILQSIFSRALGQLALGLCVGLLVVLLLDTIAGGGLLGSHSTVILPAFAFLMLVAGLLAALGPARRALRIQPTEALRAE